MFIVAHHTISDPETFWTAASTVTIPDHLKLFQVLPSEDLSQGWCLWQAESIDALQSFLDPATATSARNAYFAVETAHALGLPSAAATQPA